MNEHECLWSEFATHQPRGSSHTTCQTFSRASRTLPESKISAHDLTPSDDLAIADRPTVPSMDHLDLRPRSVDAMALNRTWRGTRRNLAGYQTITYTISYEWVGISAASCSLSALNEMSSIIRLIQFMSKPCVQHILAGCHSANMVLNSGARRKFAQRRLEAAHGHMAGLSVRTALARRAARRNFLDS